MTARFGQGSAAGWTHWRARFRTRAAQFLPLMKSPWGSVVLLAAFLPGAALAIWLDWAVRDPLVAQGNPYLPHGIPAIPFCGAYVVGFALGILALAADALAGRIWGTWSRWPGGWRRAVLLGAVVLAVYVLWAWRPFLLFPPMVVLGWIPAGLLSYTFADGAAGDEAAPSRPNGGRGAPDAP